MEKIILFISSLFITVGLFGQIHDSVYLKLYQLDISKKDTVERLLFNGQVVNASISNGDTIILAMIDNVSISSPRKFINSIDYQKYLKYRRYAATVYPYAKEAIRIFKEAEHVTLTLKKRKRKKYIKRLSKELVKEFENPLKGLSKTQGKILVKMIERELDVPLFDLIKMTRGSMKAFYWNQSSKLYGYKLKEGYQKGQNPILDVVLQDFDISHEVAKN